MTLVGKKVRYSHFKEVEKGKPMDHELRIGTVLEATPNTDRNEYLILLETEDKKLLTFRSVDLHGVVDEEKKGKKPKEEEPIV